VVLKNYRIRQSAGKAANYFGRILRDYTPNFDIKIEDDIVRSLWRHRANTYIMNRSKVEIILQGSLKTGTIAWCEDW